MREARRDDATEVGRTVRLGRRGTSHRRAAAGVGDGHLDLGPVAGTTTADPRRLEGDRSPATGAHDRASGQGGRELRCISGIDHVLRVGAVTHAQRDPQIDVGAYVGRHHTGRPLRRQHEVYAERATHCGETDQPGDEVGHLLGQDPELVDDEHQSRKRRDARDALIILDVLGADAGEQLLPPTYFRAQ